jgi:hypothetical protein
VQTLADSVAQTNLSDFDRRNPTRRIGGSFERLQAVPERRAANNQGLSQADINRLVSAFSFLPQEETLASRSFFTSFGPGILGLNR